jgi:ubiquitin C-terminal hydrolase
VINHYGSNYFGHYTAYCKNNNEWLCFDDSSVESVSEHKVVSEAAYVLFYKRRDQKVEPQTNKMELEVDNDESGAV